MRYEAAFRNLTFAQAQAMYRVAVNLDDEEVMYGEMGLTWSGIIPGARNRRRAERTITISPMVGELICEPR